MLQAATEEQMKSVEAAADLTPHSMVLSNENGDLAVIRRVIEIDPILFRKETGKKGRAFFIAELEEFLRQCGDVSEYYFNVAAWDEKTIKAAERWGAHVVSLRPEIRMRRDLDSPIRDKEDVEQSCESRS